MDKVDLDALDALHAAATPGEFSFGVRDDGSAWYSIGLPLSEHIQGDIYCDRHNLKFIAALHNAYPAIAAELRALRARVAELEAANESH
jgi:hypothetical protein